MNVMKKSKGFTLVELIVVIAIIGILSAVLIPSFTSYISKARESSAIQEAKGVYDIYKNYLVEVDSGSLDEASDTFSEYYHKITSKQLGEWKAYKTGNPDGIVLVEAPNGYKTSETSEDYITPDYFEYKITTGAITVKVTIDGQLTIKK